MIESLVGEQITFGMQLSVICAEDADRLRVNPADADTLLGTDFVATVLAQCEVWPRGRRPADFHAPLQSDVPVLLLSGEFDPVTPPRYGEAVVRHLPNGRHLVARGQGHNVIGSGCMPRLMAQVRRPRPMPRRPRRHAASQQLAPPPPFTRLVRLGALRGRAMIAESRDLRKSFKVRGGVITRRGRRELHARDGEITGLLGPNGAGKTTTLRMLYTLMKPGRGPGAGRRRRRGARRRATCAAGWACCPTRAALYKRLTARENIALLRPPARHRRGRDRARAPSA